ncbi:CehA/McbA family metallohydrolase [Flavobacterium phycosphaerae]|uniref:CehA/McbA family metallohydrolase n=1 Tax=Flavobacterium phycosphaerae TaxID=2697515 RepID=UPI00138A4C99|nr:CehA/McbA family metallohydrolase [Flavobacterium phycosphaerae]
MKKHFIVSLISGIIYALVFSIPAFSNTALRPVSNYISIISNTNLSPCGNDKVIQPPTALTFNAPQFNTISGSFTASETANGYVSLISTDSTLSEIPADGVMYHSGDSIGNATVMRAGTSTTFVASGLLPNTTYYVFIFEFRMCYYSAIYDSGSPLTGDSTTLPPPCVAPLGQPTNIILTTATTTINGTFTATTADEYLIVYSVSTPLNTAPVNGTVYAIGDALGNGIVLGKSSAASFSATGLTPSTVYYFTVFALNKLNCDNGPAYNTTSPLVGNSATNSSSLNFYYGNFHSHTEYSDGTGLPSGDFAYADAASCMDFLGISEHNHVAAGMSLSNWIQGRAQAASASTATFLALYGMEWGVISGGGHVIVYGIPDLLGWDSGEYQHYVAKSDYIGTTGLFSTINGYGGNAFATLAHPNNSDYSNIMTTYNTEADNAIVGTAVESGPAFSTSTSYNDPPTSMAYLSYYRNMLARGYHLGPTMDHDNHNITHGHTSNIRTVVLANSLTENNILGAMRAMRFYASEDCSAQVTFKINTNNLGSIVTTAGAPVITVTSVTSSPVTSLKIYSGIPGSGTTATILTSTTSGSITYTHTALANGGTRYYYVDITESDGTRIVTSPIWYTRNDTP